jgi:hypothetical protein
MRRRGVAGKIHASGQRYAALTALQDMMRLKGPLFGLVSSARRGKRSARQCCSTLAMWHGTMARSLCIGSNLTINFANQQLPIIWYLGMRSAFADALAQRLLR